MIFQLLLRWMRRICGGRYWRLIVTSALIVVFGTVGIMAFEPSVNEQFKTYKDAFWWIFVTVTTVGYGDKFPITDGGRIVAAVVMFFGIGLLGMLISTITGHLFEKRLKEARGMKEIKEKGHIVICNWNFKAEDIVEELRSDPKTRSTPIVLIANMDQNPLEEERLLFVQGDATSESVLKRANITEASTAIVLVDEEVELAARDAKAILTVLTIESMNPAVYTCVEILDPENVQHARRARADEVVVIGELSSRLLVRSAMDHGLSHIVSDLMSGLYGNAFYTVEIPPAYVGRSIGDVFVQLKQQRDTILIALEQDGQQVTNPPWGMQVNEGDHLVVLARERPRLMEEV